MVINRIFVGRRSIRLPGFDYSQAGSYFLTICSVERKSIFGCIENGQPMENALGQIIRACWLQIPDHFSAVETDAFVIMPNHLHGILNIKKRVPGNDRPNREAFSSPTFASIPTIVRTFKAGVTRLARQQGQWPDGAIWQRDYFERVIRNGKEYVETCRYIAENPTGWESDEDHPAFVPSIDRQPRLRRGGTMYRAPTDRE
ncbi:MAG TPA: transposase [Verrucomicrobiae bacterium]|nr:transposase [Verrucomicrobiae bacterium]